MRLRIVLPFLLVVGHAAPSVAQTVPPAPDTVRTYKHQVGLTASPQLDQFFTANRSLPIGLLYRRQLRPNRTVRYRAVGSYAYDRREDPLFLGTAYAQHTTSLELAWGQEWWLPVSQRFTAYAGMEGGAFIHLIRKKFKVYQPGFPVSRPGLPPVISTAVNDGTENWGTQGVYVQPFAGVRWQFSKRLAAELEAEIPISFSRRNYKLDYISYDIATGNYIGGGGEGDITYYSLTTQLHPINRLHLVFSF